MSDEVDIQDLLDEATNHAQEAKGKDSTQAQIHHRQASELYSKAVTATEKTYGKTDPVTLEIRNLWAISLRNAGDVNEAIQAHEENLARHRRCETPQVVEMLRIRRHLAENYAAVREYAKAIRVYRTIVNTTGSETSPASFRDRLNQALAIHKFGKELQDAEKIKEAMNLTEKVLKQAMKDLEKDDMLIFEIRHHLCEELLELGRCEEALATVKENIGLFQERKGSDPGQYLERMKRLQVQCHSELKKNREAQGPKAHSKRLVDERREGERRKAAEGSGAANETQHLSSTKTQKPEDRKLQPGFPKIESRVAHGSSRFGNQKNKPKNTVEEEAAPVGGVLEEKSTKPRRGEQDTKDAPVPHRQSSMKVRRGRQSPTPDQNEQLLPEKKHSSNRHKSRPRSADSWLRVSHERGKGKSSHRHSASANMTAAEKEDVRRLIGLPQTSAMHSPSSEEVITGEDPAFLLPIHSPVSTRSNAGSEDPLGSSKARATFRTSHKSQDPRQASEHFLETKANPARPAPPISIIRTDTTGFSDLWSSVPSDEPSDEPSELKDPSMEQRLSRRTQAKDDLVVAGMLAPEKSSTRPRRATSAEPPRKSPSHGALYSSPTHTRESDRWYKDFTDNVHVLLKYEDDTLPKLPSPTVKIAILDTGVAKKTGYGEVPRMKSPRVQRGKDLDKSLPWNVDENGHGTHAAGLILSVCPYADLYVYRIVRNREDEISREYVKEALEHAIDSKKVDIISMSFGWPEDSDTELQGLLEYAKSKKVLLFAATSNEGIYASLGLAYPARADEVIAIDAADEDGVPLPTNPEDEYPMRFTAPGKSVLSTYPTNLAEPGEKKPGWKRMSGTSCATPIAAAMAACVLVFAQQRPLCLDPEVKTHLKSITGMRALFENLLTIKRRNDPVYRHLRPTMLFNCKGQADGGNWYDVESVRYVVAMRMLDGCLRKKFSDKVGEGLPSKARREWVARQGWGVST